ncbi:MAG: hypothetical protein WCV50_00680 [Patescibacteria group bacterium]|jgi:hypothetical protein
MSWNKGILSVLIIGVILIYLVIGLKYIIQWTSQEWTAVGTIFLGISAVVVAISSEWFKTLHKPKLRPFGSNTIEQQIWLKVVRLSIKNTSYISASDVEANIIKKIDSDGKQPKYIPLPLFWTHSQLHSNRLYRNIYPQQEVSLDIANLIMPKNESPMLQLALSAGREISKWSTLNPGKTYIVLELNEKRGSFLKADIEINWDGTKNNPIISIIDFSN